MTATPVRIPPPAVSFPFVDLNRCLTPSALQFLQPLFAVAQGLAGVVSSDTLLPAPIAAIRHGAVSPSPIAWTPTVAGSSTAGVQTYSAQWGMHVDVGPVRLSLFSMVLTALDGATAGSATIGGFSMPANGVAGALHAGWLSDWGKVTMSGGYTALGLHMVPGSAAAALVQSGTALNVLALPTSGLAATSAFTGGVAYLR